MNLEAGQTRGNWTLIRFYEGEGRERKPAWKCRCKCGNEALVNLYSLTTRTSSACIKCRGAAMTRIPVERGTILHGWECVELIAQGTSVEDRRWVIRCTGCGFLARREEKSIKRPESKTKGIGCASCARHGVKI